MRVCFIFILLSLPHFMFGQDSIAIYKSQLLLNQTDSDREEVLFEIIGHYATRGQFDRDSIRKYNNQLLTLLKDQPISENKAKSKAYRLLADYRMPYKEYAPLAEDLISDYLKLKKYEGVLKEHFYLSGKAARAGVDKSIEMFEKGIQMTEDFKGYLDEDILCQYRSKLSSSLASNYEFINLYSQAVEQALAAVQHAESCNDSLSMLYAYRTAGAILGNAKNEISNIEGSSIDINKELEGLLKKALEFAKNLDDDVTYSMTSYNLANFHYENDSIDLALHYLNDSESTEDMKWLPKQRYFIQSLYASIYQDLGKNTQSFQALERSAEAVSKLNEPYYAKKIHIEYAEWYLKEELYDQSMASLNKVKIQEVSDLDIKLDYYEVLRNIEKSRQRFDKAIAASEIYYTLKDSLNKISSAQSIAGLMGQYRISKANEEIASLQSKQLSSKLDFQRNAGFGILGFLLVIGFLGSQSANYKRNLLKSKEENQKTQQQLFRAQMNPHFIFNTLGSIQSFLLQPEKSKDAAYFLSKFAKLMRQILSQSEQHLIPLEEEVKTLNNYLLLQKMRFDEKFDFSIDVDPKILNTVDIPPMIIQPIIENAIEHGKIYNQKNGHVNVSISEMDKTNLEVLVVDNGVGILAASKMPSSKSSMSTNIIKQRLLALSQKTNRESKLTFESPETGGTIVRLLLPKISKAPSLNNEN